MEAILYRNFGDHSKVFFFLVKTSLNKSLNINKIGITLLVAQPLMSEDFTEYLG